MILKTFEHRSPDPFMIGHLIILSNLGELRQSLKFRLVRIFWIQVLYTSRNIFSYTAGPILNVLSTLVLPKVSILMVGVNILGDKTTIITEVKTTWENFYSEQEFLILVWEIIQCVGFIWYNSVMTANRSEVTKIVDIKGFGMPEEVPIEFN